ncbi:MAG: hypothetical protein O7B99_05810 [Planctomycetota bacterium]|nr:hypothetical protein [Planctomycetota bacterium]
MILAALLFLSVPNPAQYGPYRQEDPLPRLRELAEVGLPSDVARIGAPLVAQGGALAEHGEAIAIVARALFEIGDEGLAVELLEQARPTPETRVAVELARARLALERDDLKGALERLAPGADPERMRYPEEPESWLLFGRACARLGRYDAAEPASERFVALAPLHAEAPTAWHVLFQAAVARGDGERAKQCREEERRLRLWHALLTARRVQVLRSPQAPLPRLGIALLWMEVDALAEARAALDELVALAPDFCAGWLRLGVVHARAGRSAVALRAHERALTCYPEEHRARLARARLLLEAGRNSEAQEDLERIVASDVEAEAHFLAAHLHLARLLRAAGEEDGARRRYGRYVELGGTEPLEPGE